MSTPGPHIKNFNERVKIMNQSNKKEMVLTSQDVRNLHADIFALLALNNELTARLQEKSEEGVVQVNMDGGSF